MNTKGLNRNMGEPMLQQTDYKYGFSDDIEPRIQFDKGLSPMVIKQISGLKDEPRWLLDYRMKAYKIFLDKSDLSWGADLSGLDFNDIRYYVSHTEKSETNWDDVPDDIKNTFCIYLTPFPTLLFSVPNS